MPVYYKNKTVAVLNKSTVLTDDQVKSYCAAVDIQVNQHFGPIWGIFASVKFMTEDELKRLRSAPMVLYFIDVPEESGMDGVLGYHTQTDKGQPIAYVFAKTDIDYGLEPSITFSHEVLEMLADPTTCFNASITDRNNNVTLYSIEVCDAVEDDSQCYLIDGVKVSNFVFPDWFDPTKVNGEQLDFRSLVKKPLQILDGGYMPILRIGKDDQWTEIRGQGIAKRLDVKKKERPQMTRTFKRNQLMKAQKEIL